MGYKIRDTNTGQYSNGIILRCTEYNTTTRCYDARYDVTWGTKGKIWKTEKAVKDHLLKYALAVGKPTDWEIVEIIENPTKPIHDWFDAAMILKLLKKK